jgi:hypothetical protein
MLVSTAAMFRYLTIVWEYYGVLRSTYAWHFRPIPDRGSVIPSQEMPRLSSNSLRFSGQIRKGLCSCFRARTVSLTC